MSVSRAEEGSTVNIWDSVQRGLEKATQEATRIAKTQRLRSTIDGLTRQIHTQEDELIARAMEAFAAGQLTQPELIPICQELNRLQQQLELNRQELTQVQNQGTQPSAAGAGQTLTPPAYPSGTDLSPTIYAPPPDYRPYDATRAAPPPPPPPGVDPLTVSSFDTVRGVAPDNETPLCQQCGVELLPGNAYCHNCGTAVLRGDASYQPTMRGTIEPGQETMRASSGTPSPAVPEQTPHTPPSIPIQLDEQDGGH